MLEQIVNERDCASDRCDNGGKKKKKIDSTRYLQNGPWRVRSRWKKSTHKYSPNRQSKRVTF